MTANRAAVIVMPHSLGVCRCCGNQLIMDVHMRVAEGFELADVPADESLSVQMIPIGVRVAHDCVPGPSRAGAT